MKLFEKFQTLMAAAAFAEENEPETARAIASEALAPAPKRREVHQPVSPIRGASARAGWRWRPPSTSVRARIGHPAKEDA